VTARIIALVLALLLVGGAAGAWAEAPAPDDIAAIDPAIAVARAEAPAPPRAIVPHSDGALLGAGRAAIDSIFRPPRTLAI
jgi:hypothetical protein